ncbi:uncharacterized protein M6B38_353215 [Iris pallida]|uniref:Uncharacterized protein n=1 Tax=Iris pallida TaxID=29817 RepID=A0AAX6GQ02_IRIPA|nr:uncharacterized protein M6B38_167320 [Iris pallida]KAJ6830633.1 uncharacterized protein M6B38_353215 [Iris pallida]
MDPISKEASEELARDSLIALSQSPEKDITSNVPKVGLGDDNGIDFKDSGSAEEYRSKLISISYTQSPDFQPVHSSVESPNI